MVCIFPLRFNVLLDAQTINFTGMCCTANQLYYVLGWEHTECCTAAMQINQKTLSSCKLSNVVGMYLAKLPLGSPVLPWWCSFDVTLWQQGAFCALQEVWLQYKDAAQNLCGLSRKTGGEFYGKDGAALTVLGREARPLVSTK